jgi:hypothetical protein
MKAIGEIEAQRSQHDHDQQEQLKVHTSPCPRPPPNPNSFNAICPYWPTRIGWPFIPIECLIIGSAGLARGATDAAENFTLAGAEQMTTLCLDRLSLDR